LPLLFFASDENGGKKERIFSRRICGLNTDFIHIIIYIYYPKQTNKQKAVVVLTGTAGVAGTLTLTQDDPSGATTVVGDITGLAPGKHGLHVHEFGDTTNGCMSTGPHFNPNKMTHGAPTDSVRHAGDLGNVIADAGGCKFTIKDMQIPLSGANSIVGRAFVIHELEDDLGKGDNSEIGTQGKTSSTTGNAGARLVFFCSYLFYSFIFKGWPAASWV
jgi:Cu-Zn family superoxide dismutase